MVAVLVDREADDSYATLFRSIMFMLVFFFKQKTAYEIYQCDWSSDVCSSDLTQPAELAYRIGHNPCVGRCYRGKIEFEA